MNKAPLQALVSPSIQKLLEIIRQVGGRPVLVGGCVRDALLGFGPKDIDIEVYGLPSADLKAAIKPYARVFAVGVSFGVLKVYLLDGTEVDVSLPRRDSRPGELGDLGVADPTTTPLEAASRRDFTINAMAFDPATADLLDYFGGQADLVAQVLRHVGPAFAHDPLRVLRGMQFAARWDFRLAAETIQVCADLQPAYLTLAKERVWGEWYKWARLGRKPSAGMTVLEQTSWRGLYPPLESLATRSLWSATLQALDRAALIARRDGVTDEPCTVLLLATLAHAFEPEEVEAFLTATGCPLSLVRQVINLTGERLTYRQQLLTPTAVRRLAYRLGSVELVQWVRLVEATDPATSVSEWLRLASELGYAEGMVKPLLLGRHLQEAGLKPGRNFKVLLDAALEAQLDGLFSTVEGAQAWLTRRLASEEV